MRSDDIKFLKQIAQYFRSSVTALTVDDQLQPFLLLVSKSWRRVTFVSSVQDPTDRTAVFSEALSPKRGVQFFGRNGIQPKTAQKKSNPREGLRLIFIR